MATIQDLVAKATFFLARYPKSAGVFIWLPTFEHVAAVPTMRSPGDIHVSIDSHEGMFRANIERVLDHDRPSALAITAGVDSVQAPTLEQFGPLLVKCLSKVFPHPDADLKNHFTYRINNFASFTEPASPAPKASWLGLIISGAHAAAPELWTFVSDTVQAAIAFEPMLKSGDSVSVWFTPSDQHSTLYGTITFIAKDAWQVSFEDRIVYPWKEKSERINDIAKAPKVLSDYIARTHAKTKGLKVYFAFKTRVA